MGGKRIKILELNYIILFALPILITYFPFEVLIETPFVYAPAEIFLRADTTSDGVFSVWVVSPVVFSS